MARYRLISLTVVLMAAAFVVGMKVGEHRAAARATADASVEEPCCEWPEDFTPAPEPEMPKIPPVAGLASVVQFGRYENEECEAGAEILETLEGDLEGHAGVAVVDTQVHRGAADRWRLRMVPTHVFLDAEGEEVSRHEGAITRDEVLAGLRAAGAELP